MENDDRLKIGFALTGSFCTFSKVIPQVEKLIASGIDIIPIMSEKASSTDTRFGKAEDFKEQLTAITGSSVLTKQTEVESIGPKKLIDALIIAHCTGSTLSKLANGISDTTVTLAAKATLRNNRPIIIAVSTNDGLSASAKNIGLLLNTKNFYFAPYGQDDPSGKPCSLVADMDKLLETLTSAICGRQIQPILSVKNI
ncbi:MAG: dipicolinate synthase subunit B [Bacillota bacterium]|nr:dipicolinate synthase subunit B [Bacillota bacterium]